MNSIVKYALGERIVNIFIKRFREQDWLDNIIDDINDISNDKLLEFDSGYNVDMDTLIEEGGIFSAEFNKTLVMDISNRIKVLYPNISNIQADYTAIKIYIICTDMALKMFDRLDESITKLFKGDEI